MLDLWRGGLTPRKAFVLARHLPAGAQVWIATGSDAAWTTGEHLTAAVADILLGANWQRAGGKGKRPQPIDRPADLKRAQERTDKAVSQAEKFAALYGVPDLHTPPAIEPPRPTQPRDERGRFVSQKG